MIDIETYKIASCSSISSDEGIREDNYEILSLNQNSSTTVSDDGITLNSNFDCNICSNCASCSAQTIVQTDEDCCGIGGNTFKTSTFHLDISGEPLSARPCIDFRKQPELAQSATSTIEIPDHNVTSTSAIKSQSLSVRAVSAITISRLFNLTSSTFQEAFLPHINVQSTSNMSKNLNKLRRQLSILNGVFNNFRHGSTTTVIPDRNYDLMNMKDVSQKRKKISYKEVKITEALTDEDMCYLRRVDSMNLHCKFIRACVIMIRRYPFYYGFLDKCYTEEDFNFFGKFHILKPEENTFEKAIIKASKYHANHLETIDSMLRHFSN